MSMEEAASARELWIMVTGGVVHERDMGLFAGYMLCGMHVGRNARPAPIDAFVTCQKCAGMIRRMAKAAARAAEIRVAEERVMYSPEVTEAIRHVPDYVGHWRGEGWESHHGYGVTMHMSEYDARRWCMRRLADNPGDLRPVSTGDGS